MNNNDILDIKKSIRNLSLKHGERLIFNSGEGYFCAGFEYKGFATLSISIQSDEPNSFTIIWESCERPAADEEHINKDIKLAEEKIMEHINYIDNLIFYNHE